ncbi:hypothetical protein K470DRAFT_26139 [Piedraia hortae CBS 480.64]|uniref:Small ribosomal subunit protein mS33 n=1 Tax=Piedraia hortae CBS 480.64 TaxID=1314780 RepID=A0A6A7C359_9PEZI|nr:hypothetical protein K470DRAFT_26139 [Piedraia hortae CBS 480.64]
MSVPRPLILTLQQIQSKVFNTIFNPSALRLGNKILKQPLRGALLSAYYPRRVATFRELKGLYPNYDLYDEKEETRLEDLEARKKRGKGNPRKKRSGAESRAKGGKKKR